MTRPRAERVVARAARGVLLPGGWFELVVRVHPFARKMWLDPNTRDETMGAAALAFVHLHFDRRQELLGAEDRT